MLMKPCKIILIVQNVPPVVSILDIFRKTTWMGFAAVARVTEDE